MTIVAIADALLDGAMRARFHAEPIVQATELLLQERTPRGVAVAHPWAAAESTGKILDVEPPVGRRLSKRTAPRPRPTSCRTAATRLCSPPLGRVPAAGTTGPSPVGARIPPATTGARMSFCATLKAAMYGRPGFSLAAPSPMTTMLFSTRIALNSRAATERSKRLWRCSSRRRTTPRSVASRYPTLGPRARDRSHVVCRTRPGAPG